MIKDVRNRIHAILDTIPEIKTVPPRIPSGVQKFELPMAFARHTGTTMPQPESSDTQLLQLTFQISLFVAEVNLGLRAENEDVSYDIVTQIYQKFLTSQQLQDPVTRTGLTSVRYTLLTGDGGLRAPIPYPDGQGIREFYGYQINVRVDYEQYCY